MSIHHTITISGLSPPISLSFPYLHDEPSVDEPRSLSDAEVGAAELHQAVVVHNLKEEREGEISRQSLSCSFPHICTCGKYGKLSLEAIIFS